MGVWHCWSNDASLTRFASPAASEDPWVVMMLGDKLEAGGVGDDAGPVVESAFVDVYVSVIQFGLLVAWNPALVRSHVAVRPVCYLFC